MGFGEEGLDDPVGQPLHRAPGQDRGEDDVGDAGADHLQEQGAGGRRCLWVVAADDRLHRAGDLARVAPYGGTVPVEDLVLLPELRRRRPRGVPDVGMLGGDAQDPIARPADQDRRMRLLPGLRLTYGALEANRVAIEVEWLVIHPPLADDGAGLPQGADRPP